MMTNEKTERNWIIFVVAFISWLLLGSFIVGRSIFDLCYLIVLYTVILLRNVVFK